jgi:hypothetical protein
MEATFNGEKVKNLKELTKPWFPDLNEGEFVISDEYIFNDTDNYYRKRITASYAETSVQLMLERHDDRKSYRCESMILTKEELNKIISNEKF